MKFNQISTGIALALTIMGASAAYAAEGSLSAASGATGSALAAADGKEVASNVAGSLVAEGSVFVAAPESNGADQMAQGLGKLESALNDGVAKADAAYADAGNKIDSSASGAAEAATSLASEVPSDVNVNYTGNTSQELDVAGLATANLTANASATAALNTGVTASMVAAQTATLVSSVIAARPASLAGLLR